MAIATGNWAINIMRRFIIALFVFLLVAPVKAQFSGSYGVSGFNGGAIVSSPLPTGNIIIALMGDSLTADRYTDSASSVSPFGTFRNAVNSSAHNWALSRNGQPWSYSQNFGVGGETSVDMLQRMTPALAVAATAPGTGKIALASIWAGTNDIGNLGLNNAATIAADVQSIGEQYEGVNNRVFYFQLVGSELWTSSDVQRTIDVNALMFTYTTTHAPSVGAPLWVKAGDKVWHNIPDPTQPDNGIASLQTPSSGVPMTLTGTTFTGGRKIRFTLTAAEGAGRPMAINGSYLGQPVSETTTIQSGKKLWVSTNIYDTLTSITPTNSFATTVQVGWTGITQEQGDTYDGLHQTASGSYKIGGAIYDTISAAYAPIAVTKAGSQALLNPVFSMLTGGTGSTGVTVNGVASSSSNVPVNWRPINSDTSNITTADFIFSNNSAQVTVIAGASTTGGITLRQDPSTALFTPGDTWNVWVDVTVGAGSANIKDFYGQLTLAYANTGALPISTLSWAANPAPFNGGIVTVTTTSPHGLTTGEVWPATVASVTPSGYNTTPTQAIITGASTLQYYNILSDPGPGTGGTISMGGSLIYFDDKTVASAGGIVPTSAQDRTFQYRFPGIPVQHGIAINSVNYITGVDFSGASNSVIVFKNFHAGKS